MSTNSLFIKQWYDTSKKKDYARKTMSPGNINTNFYKNYGIQLILNKKTEC